MRRFKLFSVVVLTSLLLMSSGGGKGGGKGGGGVNSIPCESKIVPIILQSTINFGNVPNRLPQYQTMQPVSNILNGFQSTSPSSIYQQTDKNYCHITITSHECSGYGNGGTKTYIWDSTNDGVSNDSKMNIEIPKNGKFTITVDLHEGCGAWYYGAGFKRAMWVHQKTYIPGDLIFINT